MGMFDSVYLKIRCPFCKKISKMEFQTKDGECFLNNYKKGQVFDKGQFRRVDAIGSCNSFRCSLEAAKEYVWTAGYWGGFSRSFDAYIYCDSRGRITNKIKIYRLNYHKGIMHGKLGELKGKEDNMKVVKDGYYDNKKKKWVEAKMKKMTTNGWLDKFIDDKKRYSYENGKPIYEAIMYLFNLKDGEEAFRFWFIFRYKLSKIIKILKEGLKLKENEEFASLFLSNDTPDILNFCDLFKK